MPVVEPQAESIAAAITPETRVATQEILKSDTEESFSVRYREPGAPSKPPPP